MRLPSSQVRTESTVTQLMLWGRPCLINPNTIEQAGIVCIIAVTAPLDTAMRMLR
jgi:hypothetical protein